MTVFREWCVYEETTGIVLICTPSTEENARREAKLAGKGMRAVPLKFAKELANAWCHGRSYGRRSKRELRSMSEKDKDVYSMESNTAMSRIDDALDYLNQCGILRIEPDKHKIQGLLRGEHDA